ncbi:MAG TPA: PrgI family protein [Chloroflexota bacterium]|nr:PrgI family protein [Chloroflexota bacterium]
MLQRQHEIPTHLNVEDKLVFGLTARQFLYLLVGGSLAFAPWEQLATAPSGLRIAVTIACLIAGGAFALLRPFGRPVEEWLLAALLYVFQPHTAVWHPLEPEVADWRPSRAGWQELAPSLIWAEGELE